MEKILRSSQTWTPEATTVLSRLVIEEGAQIQPPRGKCVCVTVNGVNVPPAPGVYEGRITVEITDVIPAELNEHGVITVFELLSAIYIVSAEQAKKP